MFNTTWANIEEQVIQMRKYNQGWAECRAIIILADDVIPFEFPNTIGVLLHFLVSVAIYERNNMINTKSFPYIY